MTFANEGPWDRVIRLVAGVVLGYAAWATWPATSSLVALVVAVAAVVTGIVGWCPAYAMLGVSTGKKMAG